MSEPNEIEAHIAAQEREYGTYVAIEPIFYGGARAFNAGDPVPVSHVKEYGYLDDKLVAKVGTKAAESAAPTTDSPPKG